jgi:hypothetical protein
MPSPSYELENAGLACLLAPLHVHVQHAQPAAPCSSAWSMTPGSSSVAPSLHATEQAAYHWKALIASSKAVQTKTIYTDVPEHWTTRCLKQTSAQYSLSGHLQHMICTSPESSRRARNGGEDGGHLFTTPATQGRAEVGQQGKLAWQFLRNRARAGG